MAKKTAKKSGSRTTGRSSGKSTRSSGRNGGARKGAGRGRANAAFMQPMTPSPQLAEVIGDKPMPRTEVTKKIWAYIKREGLQDQKNRRMIKADAALKPVFGGKSQVNMFEMTKLVNKHLK